MSPFGASLGTPTTTLLLVVSATRGLTAGGASSSLAGLMLGIGAGIELRLRGNGGRHFEVDL
jgi:hypothetical protein